VGEAAALDGVPEAEFAACPPGIDVVMAVCETRLQGALLATGRELFAEAEARGYLALAWRLRWERQFAAYVAWALEREAEGYRFSAAEAPLAREGAGRWSGACGPRA